jgi:hypothetical protein
VEATSATRASYEPREFIPKRRRRRQVYRAELREKKTRNDRVCRVGGGVTRQSPCFSDGGGNFQVFPYPFCSILPTNQGIPTIPSHSLSTSICTTHLPAFEALDSAVCLASFWEIVGSLLSLFGFIYIYNFPHLLSRGFLTRKSSEKRDCFAPSVLRASIHMKYFVLRSFQDIYRSIRITAIIARDLVFLLWALLTVCYHAWMHSSVAVSFICLDETASGVRTAGTAKYRPTRNGLGHVCSILQLCHAWAVRSASMNMSTRINRHDERHPTDAQI